MVCAYVSIPCGRLPVSSWMVKQHTCAPEETAAFIPVCESSMMSVSAFVAFNAFIQARYPSGEGFGLNSGWSLTDSINSKDAPFFSLSRTSEIQFFGDDHTKPSRTFAKASVPINSSMPAVIGAWR